MAAPPQQSKLEHEIFGSDSDLSEDEDLQHQKQTRKQLIRHSPAASAEPPAEGSGDEYKDEPAPKKLPKFRKKDRTARDEDGDDERDKPKKRRKRRSSPSAAPVIEETAPVEMTPEERRKFELNQTIDNIVKSAKGGRRKKRKKDAEEEILDRYADEEVARLRESMLVAADADVTSNEAKQPATAKLRMLPEVMEVLQKSSLSQSIMDNNLLEAVKRWLEPLPDKSLPALNIQNSFFEVLQKMYIDTPSLKASGLGRVLLFYTKCTRVQPHIKRASDALIATWSRPIIQRSANYRDLKITIASSDRPSNPNSDNPAEMSLARILAQGTGPGQRDGRRVRIPEGVSGGYTIAPRGVVTEGRREPGRNRGKKDDDRLRKLQRKLQMAKIEKARI